MTAQSGAERQRKYLERLKADGWRQITVMLPPDAARVLERPALQTLSLADIISRALIATWGNV